MRQDYAKLSGSKHRVYLGCLKKGDNFYMNGQLWTVSEKRERFVDCFNQYKAEMKTLHVWHSVWEVNK